MRRECASWPLAGLREWERGYGCLLVGKAIAICWEAPTHRQSVWRYFPLEIGLAKGGQSRLREYAGGSKNTQRQIITARGPQGAHSESVAKGAARTTILGGYFTLPVLRQAATDVG